METDIPPPIYELKLRRREGKISNRLVLFLDGILALTPLHLRRLIQWKDGGGMKMGGLFLWLVAFLIFFFLGYNFIAKKSNISVAYSFDVVSRSNTAVEIYGQADKEELYLARGKVFQQLIDVGFIALNPEKYGGSLRGVAQNTLYKCLVHPQKKKDGGLVYNWECGRSGHPEEYVNGTENDAKELAQRMRNYSERVLPVMRSQQPRYLT